MGILVMPGLAGLGGQVQVQEARAAAREPAAQDSCHHEG